MPLVEEIGNKSPGVLVKSADWNALVAAVDGLATTLEQTRTEVTEKLNAIDAQVDAVATDLDALEAKVDPLLKRTFFVTLSTPKANFVIGELATIQIAVTDAKGNPITTRPWVDLVASWGQMKVVSPTTGLPGVGGRTLSVRTDAQGKAVVQLRSDHAEDVSEDDEIVVDLALKNIVAETNKPAFATFMEAATPNDPNAKSAYHAITEQYAVSPGMRSYVDTYYVKNPLIIGGGFKPIEFGEWVDYRATVVAIAKTDNDPGTPDQGHGVASTQLTFRDWIPGWYTLDFVDPVKINPKVIEFQEEIKPKIVPDPVIAIDNIKVTVNKLIVKEEGVLGKQRAYQAMHEALTTIDVPETLINVISPIQNALVIQQTLDNVATVPITAGVTNVAFSTFTDVAATKDQTFAAVETAVASQVATHVDQAKQDLQADLTTRQQEFEDSLTAPDGQVAQLVVDRFKDVQETVVKLGQIDPDRLVAVDDLTARVNTLQTAFELIRR